MSPARFLFVMFDGGGNVPAQLSIVRRLRGRGHQVRVLADPSIESEVRAVGAEPVPFRRAPHHNMRNRDADLVRDWEAASPPQAFKRFAERVFFGPAEKYARDVIEEAERYAPAAIAVDQLIYGALIGAERTGLPTASLLHTVGGLRLDGVPPMGFGLRPGTGFFSRLRESLLSALLTRMMDSGLPSLNAARTAVGLPPVEHTDDLILRSTKALVLTSAAFDFPARRLPATLKYVGPQLDDPSWNDAWRSPWSEVSKEPLVLVTLGSTYQRQGHILARLIEALGRLPVRGLVTLGNVFQPGDFKPPPNVTVVSSAPHHAVLPQASLVVAHGGHGTVIKALSYGVPVICVPLGRDQADIAVRVEASGAGLTVKPNARVDRIEHVLSQAMVNPAHAVAAKRLAAAIRVDVDADGAVTDLESLAADGARGRLQVISSAA